MHNHQTTAHTFQQNNHTMNIARMIHDAYRDCENPVPDFALLNNQLPPGQRLGGGGSSGGSSASSSNNLPNNHRLSNVVTTTALGSTRRHIVPNVSRTSAPAAATPVVYRLPAVRSNSIPSNHTATTTAGPSSSVRTAAPPAASRAPILRTTTVVRVLPVPSTSRLVPVPNRPQQQPQQQQQHRAVATAVVRPTSAARNTTAAPTNAQQTQQSVTRNIGSIFARTMIQMKTTVYKWRRATNAEADVNCAICLDQFHVDVLVRRMPCDHVFHKFCLDTWLARTQNCPTCRRRIY